MRGRALVSSIVGLVTLFVLLGGAASALGEFVNWPGYQFDLG